MSSPDIALAVPETPSKVGLGIGASVASAVGWGFAGVFAAVAWAPPAVLTFYRMAIASVVLAVLVMVKGHRIGWHVLRIAAPGGILLACDLVMFYAAVRLTRVAVATVIGTLQPALILMTAGRLFGEQIDRVRVVGTLVAVAGVAVIVGAGGNPGHHQILGDLLAVGSLFAWSGYFIVSRRAAPNIDALVYTAGVSAVGVIVALPAVFLAGDTLTDLHAGDWTWIVLLALIPGGAHFFMNWAHRHLDASVTSVIVSSNPIIAAVAAYVILGQRLGVIQIMGGFIGIVAIGFVAAKPSGQKPSMDAPTPGNCEPNPDRRVAVTE